MLAHLTRAALSFLWMAVLVTALALFLQRSSVPAGDRTERIRFYTRDQEFDYASWTVQAFWVKFNQGALGISRYLSEAQASDTVLAFIDLTRRIQQTEADLRTIYADPSISDKDAATEDLNRGLAADHQLRSWLGPLSESILQTQVGAVLAALGLAAGGQAIPPVLYHMTPAPMALIVSPRSVILQDNIISLQPEMGIEDQVALEDEVATGLDVSTLIVPIGGIGVYPTMVTQTSNINWLAEVIAHEWLHNYFTLRPLGLSYLSSPELRTMNETAASIFGKEVGRILIEVYYPEFAPPPPVPQPETIPAPEASPEPVFDFRAEMRETRVNVDRLLAEGEVERAERYMELRRQFFWDNGYRIRKLNQAYFAFYGAYADQPGGAAGDDPVAAAVRRLRESSASLAEFVTAMAWMGSYADLLGAVNGEDPQGQLR